MTEKANERVTARGRPSGTAITITVIPVIIVLISSSVVLAAFHSSSNHPRVLSTSLLIIKLPKLAIKEIRAQ